MSANIRKEEISIPADGLTLPGILAIPETARGVVLFAHGSGSSRLSPRNTYVADVLNANGFATLLMDLLTPEEDEVFENRFDIRLLVERLTCGAEWLAQNSSTADLPLGLFGASTGAAAAIDVADKGEIKVAAVVSRGGRVDLAEADVEKFTVPLLCIVGAKDEDVLAMTQETVKRLPKDNRHVRVIPGASHLFEEPGTLEDVAHIAAMWFLQEMPAK